MCEILSVPLLPKEGNRKAGEGHADFRGGPAQQESLLFTGPFG
jgi:hypothetical protein